MSGTRGIGEDAARAERARAELHAAVEPRHDLARGQAVDGRLQQLGLASPKVERVELEGREQLGDGRGREAWTEVDVLERRRGRPPPGERAMRERGRAQTAACVAGRRLHEQPVERPLAQEAAVGHAVQRDAARHAQVDASVRAVELAGLVEQDLLQAGLRAARHVVVERA